MESQRHQYRHQKRLIYEWQESLDSLTLFVQCPPIPQNIKKSSVFDIKITSSHLAIGIKGNPPYLSHDFKSVADSDESLWYIGQNSDSKSSQLVIEIQKAQKGVRWGAVFKDHESLDPVEEETLKKKLMLERFQEEHPGFDFSSAQFNGQVPDARTFMGGVK